MDAVLRWLHLSDFHVGMDDYHTRANHERLVDKIAALNRQRQIDLVFLSGDLTNSGQIEQIEQFWLEFGLPIQDIIGGEIATRTFTVPGNHDVDRKVADAFSREYILDPANSFFDPTEQGRSKRSQLLPRFKAYDKCDFSAVQTWLDTNSGAYANTLEINGLKVGIAGVNTAWLCKDNEDKELLSPGKPLLEEVLKLIKPADVRFLIGHHPIDWFEPSEQRMISALMGRYNVLYLHGHLHETWTQPRDGSGNQYLAIQAGAAFQAKEKEKWRNGFVLGELHAHNSQVRLQAWTWTPDQQDFTLEASAYPERLRQGEWWFFEAPQRPETHSVPKIKETASAISVSDGTDAPTYVPFPPNIRELLTAFESEFGFRWEPPRVPNSRSADQVYWPVRCRQPNPIHATQAFAAAALQRVGAEVHLWLDDLGSEEYRPALFEMQIKKWLDTAGGDGQKLKFHQCSNIDGKELHDAWLLMQRWLGFSQKRLKEILQLAKLWPSEITVAEEEEEVEEDLQSATTSNSSNGNAGGHEVRLRRLGKRRPRRLLSPAVVWSCLHLQSQTAGDRPIITLGGYDERPLWETWYECTDRLHLSVEHLYVPEMMVGSNTLRMAAEQTPIRWLNSRDVLDKFMEQLNAMSWEAATAPGQVIPWCFNGCVRLPQFVRGEALGFKFMMKNVTTLNDLSLVNNSKAIKELAESVWSFYG